MRRAGPSGDRDEAGERSSNSEKAVEERAAAAAGVAIDGGKGDPAECGRSPVSARAPAMVARSQTTAWALARRVTVAKSELARLRKASRMRTAVRRWLAVQLSPRRRAFKPSHPPCRPRHPGEPTHKDRSRCIVRERAFFCATWSIPRCSFLLLAKCSSSVANEELLLAILGLAMQLL